MGGKDDRLKIVQSSRLAEARLECLSTSKRVEPAGAEEPLFGECTTNVSRNSHEIFVVRPKTGNPKRVGTVVDSKPVCPRCNRNDRVTEASRYADKAFFDSGFMSDYYYGFGSARWHTGERTRFCFFRPDKSDVAYICDVKHV